MAPRPRGQRVIWPRRPGRRGAMASRGAAHNPVSFPDESRDRGKTADAGERKTCCIADGVSRTTSERAWRRTRRVLQRGTLVGGPVALTRQFIPLFVPPRAPRQRRSPANELCAGWPHRLCAPQAFRHPEPPAVQTTTPARSRSRIARLGVGQRRGQRAITRVLRAGRHLTGALWGIDGSLNTPHSWQPRLLAAPPRGPLVASATTCHQCVVVEAAPVKRVQSAATRSRFSAPGVDFATVIEYYGRTMYQKMDGCLNKHRPFYGLEVREPVQPPPVTRRADRAAFPAK